MQVNSDPHDSNLKISSHGKEQEKKLLSEGQILPLV